MKRAFGKGYPARISQNGRAIELVTINPHMPCIHMHAHAHTQNMPMINPHMPCIHMHAHAHIQNMPMQVTMIFQGRKEAEKAEAAYEQMLQSHTGRPKRKSVFEHVVGLCTPLSTRQAEFIPAAGNDPRPAAV